MNAMNEGGWKRGLALGAAILGLLGFLDAAAQAPRTPTEALSAQGSAPRVVSGQAFFGDAKYVGAEACKDCHGDHYNDWKGTWHAKMERLPSPDIIVGDFADRTIQLKKIKVKDKDGKEASLSPTVLAFRKGDKFYFTLKDADDVANNQTHEIGKVLGGNWDQGYEVKFGDNYRPAPIRWSVTQKDWIAGGFNAQDWFIWDGTPDGRPMKPEELPKVRVADAKCNGCHTTGFKFAKDKESGVWKSHGKGELGIACEACHGPGSKHVDEANAAKAAGAKLGAAAIVDPLKDLNAEQASQICAQCHGRGTNKQQADLSFPTGFLPGDTDIANRLRLWSHSGTAAPNEMAYFWPNDWAARNRQQWQDFTKSTHYTKAGMACTTCHVFHGKAEYAQLRQKPTEMCAGCHTANGRAKQPNVEMYADNPMQKQGVACVDCHMAKIGSRSRATSKSGHQWDTSSHTFQVASPMLEKTLGVRSACTQCHGGAGKPMPSGAPTPAMDNDALNAALTQRQQETRAGIDAVQKTLAAVKSRKAAARALVDQANAKLAFVLLDGSLGAHNPERAATLTAEAGKLAEAAARIK